MTYILRDKISKEKLEFNSKYDAEVESERRIIAYKHYYGKDCKTRHLGYEIIIDYKKYKENKNK